MTNQKHTPGAGYKYSFRLTEEQNSLFEEML